MKVKSSSKYRLCRLPGSIFRWFKLTDRWAVVMDVLDDKVMIGGNVLHYRKSTVVYQGSMHRCLLLLHNVSEHVEEISVENVWVDRVC